MAADVGQDLITLTTDKLSADSVSQSVTCPSCGAVSLFIGQSLLRCITMDHCFCLELAFLQLHISFICNLLFQELPEIILKGRK